MKELIDKFLTSNFEEINHQRVLSKDFRWENVKNDFKKWYEINNKSILTDLITGETLRHRFCKLRKKTNNSVYKDFNTSSSTVSKFQFFSGKEDKTTGKKEFNFTASEIPTEEEIITHFNIDITRYRIVQVWHKTTPSGKYSISVNLQALKGSESINYKKEFEDFVNKRNLTIFANFTEKHWETNKNSKDLNCTVVINLADLHLGKLVSEAETGERYNIDIAKERFIDSVTYLAQKSYQCYGVKKFILSTLGDTLHIDSLKSTTTAGTYVESDTRASKVFQTALDVITEAIEILKQYAPEVEFININGNHCELSEQHLGIALKAYFRSDKQVIIDSEPRNRKYRLVGENFLTWNHGDTNVATLPLTVATEQSEMWGKSKFRIIQLGHLHSTKKRVYQAEDEFNGVIVRHFSSLSGTDFWHDKNNFKGSQKRGTALIFSDVEIGIIGEFYKTV